MKTYNAEIIGVGTELLLGQIANTNAQFISDQLAKTGINIYYHQAVGDNLKRVKDSFKQAATRSDFVFVTGGLGPTEDDLTREAFQALTGKHLVENKQIIEKISNYFDKTNRKMAANNRKQAQIFSDAVIIQNQVGTAPGMIVTYQQSLFIFMPGVPKEMKPMMLNFVLPYLKENFQLKNLIKSRMLKFIGISESQLETDVKVLIDKQENPTIAPLASDGEVALRITAKAENEIIADQLIEHAENEIKELVGPYFYGYDGTTINDTVLHLLAEKNLTIASAESLTGGLFADALVSIPGAGKTFMGSIVSYEESTKSSVLGVSEQTIKTEGTVSDACAYEMAKQASVKFDASIGISFTGVAGPDKAEGKDVGTVFISIYQGENRVLTKSFYFPGERDTIRNRTVKKGLELLYYWLIE
ncbi:putative competence-damage inducible protein [Paraliobacillus quinghaiensis]|uniref:Putative competence-damage inducible protein n=1 Tax=Paraliobacillus quinghaiensis TaxID=470815 RepID=A0A917WPX3_9BACI|nr:competence/damage-inducible protein A [Paraliobacillus quinghaiensis]GGM21975.1 putative competence-damage inducible protein [Paraliobacillus quinghaiensis]